MVMACLFGKHNTACGLRTRVLQRAESESQSTRAMCVAAHACCADTRFDREVSAMVRAAADRVLVCARARALHTQHKAERAAAARHPVLVVVGGGGVWSGERRAAFDSRSSQKPGVAKQEQQSTEQREERGATPLTAGGKWDG